MDQLEQHWLWIWLMHVIHSIPLLPENNEEVYDSEYDDAFHDVVHIKQCINTCFVIRTIYLRQFWWKKPLICRHSGTISQMISSVHSINCWLSLSLNIRSLSIAPQPDIETSEVAICLLRRPKNIHFWLCYLWIRSIHWTNKVHEMCIHACIGSY